MKRRKESGADGAPSGLHSIPVIPSDHYYRQCLFSLYKRIFIPNAIRPDKSWPRSLMGDSKIWPVMFITNWIGDTLNWFVLVLRTSLLFGIEQK
jgi:hypothetical protein